jgi:hypothetical protein
MLQVELGVFPILESAGTLVAGAGKVRFLLLVERDQDVAADDEVFAAIAESRFVQIPPLRVGIGLIEQTQPPSLGEK